MSEPIMTSQAQAKFYLDKAEMYKKLGLKAQVQYELEQARRVDPYIAQEIRYKTLLEENVVEVKKIEELKTPLRIGAGMLFINAIFGIISLILVFSSGGGSNLGSGDIISPLVNIVIGVNLWQTKVPWQKYTLWWATLGLVLFGGGALISGDFVSLLIQLGFDGALILMFVGRPSKVRTYSAVGVFLVLYLGMICLLFTVSFLGGLTGAL